MADFFFANIILAIQKSGLDRNEKAILSALCGLVDWQSWSKQVPIRYVAIRASVSPDTVQRTVKALASKGMVSYSTVDGGAPDWTIHAQAVMDLEVASLRSIPRVPQVAVGEPLDAVGDASFAAPPHPTQSAATPTQAAVSKAQFAVGSPQVAVASPILSSDPLIQSTISNPVRNPQTPLAGGQQQLPAIPPKASTKRQVKPPADPKPPAPEKPPMPAKYDGHPHSRQIAGLWYGTECAAKGGPDAEGFILAVDAIVAFVDAQGQGFAVDRPVFHYVRAAIRQWIDSGQPYQAVIDAAQAEPTEYEIKHGFCTIKGRLGSVDAIQRQVSKARQFKHKSGNWRQAGSLGAPTLWAPHIDDKDEVAF